MKGVSAILASVLIVLVVISLSGAFLIYTQRTSTQLTEGATKQQQTLQQRLDVQFILEGVSGSQATLRNTGDNAITYGTLSVFLDDVLINYTLPAAIAPGQTGTVYLNQTWKAGLGERTLRVTGRSLSDSVRVRVDKPAGNVLDLRFDDNKGTSAQDSSGNTNIGTLSGILRADFEGILDGGFSIDCNPPTSAYVTGAIGQGLKLWSTATDAACLYKPQLFGVNSGYVVWFYGKGYVQGGIYNSGNWYSYVQDVESGCRTPDATVEMYVYCNGGNAYVDWRLFKLVAYTNSGTRSDLYFYSKNGGFGEANAAYYDFVTDGPVWTNGRVGKALRFDGTDDYVDVPYSSSLQPSTITIEAWANARVIDNNNGNGGDDWYGIVTNKGGASDGINLQMGLTQQIASLVGNGASNTYVKTSWNPLVETWYHIVIVHDASDNSNRLYVNGKLESTDTFSLSYAVQPTRVGRFYTSSLPFDGLVDEVRIYDRAYAPDELYIVNRA